MDEQLRDAWDDVAPGYQAYWSPRFRPWVEHAVAALPDVPRGLIWNPCCGPGDDLSLLTHRFPNHKVMGSDFSESMVSLCRERGLMAEVADAADPPSKVAGLVSVFGLQMIPEADEVFRRWRRCLAPGGALSVMFWPAELNDGGPFDVLQQYRQDEDTAWMERLRLGGCEDSRVPYPVRHQNVRTFWRQLRSSGPGQVMAQKLGSDILENIEQQLVGVFGEGELVHTPHAQLLVLKT